MKGHVDIHTDNSLKGNMIYGFEHVINSSAAQCGVTKLIDHLILSIQV